MEIKQLRIMAHILVLLYVFSAIAPLLLTVIYDLGFAHPPEITDLEKQAVKDIRLYVIQEIARSAVLTFICTGLATALAMVCGVMMSFALHAYSFPGRRMIWGLIVLCIILPARFYHIKLAEILIDLGVQNGFMMQTFAYAAQATPLVVLLTLLQMRSLPPHILDWYQFNTPNPLEVLAKGIVPHIRLGLMATAIVINIPMWNDLWVPLLFFDNHDLYAPRMLQIITTVTWFDVGIYSILAPALVPTMILYGLFIWNFTKSASDYPHDTRHNG